MAVAVTGASGRVGGNLVRALLERGRHVRAVVRDDVRALEGLDVERVRADVLDPPSSGSRCSSSPGMRRRAPCRSRSSS